MDVWVLGLVVVWGPIQVRLALLQTIGATTRPAETAEAGLGQLKAVIGTFLYIPTLFVADLFV